MSVDGDVAPLNPHLAASLAAFGERVAMERVDTVWLFPARQAGARESGLAVLSLLADDGQAARTIYTVGYVVEPPSPGAAPRRVDEVAEQGTVPPDRVGRIIDGVVRRLEVPETPDVREISGDVGKWRELLAGLGGVVLDPANRE